MNLHHDEVRKQRSTLAVCPSAKENVCVTDILYEIIEKETYKKDYEEITLGLLFVPETYDTVIQSIKKIADSGIWNYNKWRISHRHFFYSIFTNSGFLSRNTVK